MARNASRPASAHDAADLEIGICCRALSDLEHTAPAFAVQPSRAAARIARRYGLPAATAALVCELASIGEVRP